MKKLTAIGVKEEDKPFSISSKKVFQDSLNNLPNGKYKITVEKYFKKSSQAQFGWLYACV